MFFLNTNLFCIVFLLRVHLITEGTCIFSFPPKWRGTRAFHSGAKHTSHFNTLWRVSTDILVSENFEFVGLIRPLNFKYFSSQTTGLGSFAWLRLKIPKDHHWRKLTFRKDLSMDPRLVLLRWTKRMSTVDILLLPCLDWFEEIRKF